MSDLDYAAESGVLDRLEKSRTDRDATAQKIAVAAARYQLDQAVSLAILADTVEALVNHVIGVTPPDEATTPEASDQLWTLATEADIGDTVVVADPETGGPFGDRVRHLVTEVGVTEGEAWLKVNGEDVKLWGKGFVIVEGADDDDEELADRIEAEDDDWKDSARALADRVEAAVQAPDAFATLKKGKAKK